MTFSIPRPNVIECDAGYAVEVLGRTGLRYSEGPRTMRIDAEVLDGPAGLMLYRHSVAAWDDPHQGDPLDDEGKERIVDRIRAAFRFRGFEIQVV